MTNFHMFGWAGGGGASVHRNDGSAQEPPANTITNVSRLGLTNLTRGKESTAHITPNMRFPVWRCDMEGGIVQFSLLLPTLCHAH
jgi:hypothetical protein